MRIKIDIDGVLRDMLSSMISIYNETFKQNLTINQIEDYDIAKSFPAFQTTCRDPYKFFFDEHEKWTILSPNPYDGVVFSMKKLHDKGHKLVIVTKQPSTASKKDTIEWLYMWDIPYDEIHFANEKWRIEGDILIDDNPEYLNEEREKSIKICINMPYNQGSNGIRFKTFNDAADFIIDNEELLSNLKKPTC